MVPAILLFGILVFYTFGLIFVPILLVDYIKKKKAKKKYIEEVTKNYYENKNDDLSKSKSEQKFIKLDKVSENNETLLKFSSTKKQ